MGHDKAHSVSGADHTGSVGAAQMPALTGDVTTSAGAVATTLAAGSASNLNSGTLAAGRLPALTGDVTSSAGSAATTLAAGSAANLNSGTLNAARLPALTGDVTTSAGSAATSIAANAVTLAKLATQTNNTILGNNSGSTAVPSALTATQVSTLIGIQVGAVSGSDFLFTTSDATNYQSITGLSFTIGASSSEVWLVELFILLNAANATMDSIFRFTVPASTTFLIGGSGMSALGSASGTQSWGIQGASASPGALSAVSVTAGTVAGTAGVGIQAIVQGGGTGGTVQFQGRQATSDAGQLTAKIGSSLRATRTHT